MKKLIIVNVGSAPEVQREKYGDFEVWAKKAIESSYNPKEKNHLEIIFHDGISNPLPNFNEIAGAIIMGSLSMVTEKNDWILRLSKQIIEMTENNIPLLGICFGHQLIAQALGGNVNFHPKGLEIGTVTIHKQEAAKEDPIFATLPSQFLAHTVHFQSVLTLPKHAILLMSNNFEAHHAFRVGQSTWGVQFHPEFTTEIMNLSLENLKENIVKNYAQKQAAIQDTKDARQVLIQFSKYCQR